MQLFFVLLLAADRPKPPDELMAAFVQASKEETAKSRAFWARETTNRTTKLAALKRSRTFTTDAEKEVAVRAAQERLEEAQQITRGQRLVPAKLPYEKLAVGQMGTLVDDRVRVRQVVDKSSLLGEVTLSYQTYEVVGRTALPEQKFRDELVWISGVSTETFVDGKLATLPQVFWVCGTKQYNTALGGTKTVLELRAVDVSEALTVASSPPSKSEARTEARELRTWTDATGGFTLQAKFGGIVGGKVVLVKEDGSKVFVTREQLSKGDNDCLDGLTKK